MKEGLPGLELTLSCSSLLQQQLWEDFWEQRQRRGKCVFEKCSAEGRHGYCLCPIPAQLSPPVSCLRRFSESPDLRFSTPHCTAGPDPGCQRKPRLPCLTSFTSETLFLLVLLNLWGNFSFWWVFLSHSSSRLCPGYLSDRIFMYRTCHPGLSLRNPMGSFSPAVKGVLKLQP